MNLAYILLRKRTDSIEATKDRGRKILLYTKGVVQRNKLQNVRYLLFKPQINTSYSALPFIFMLICFYTIISISRRTAEYLANLQDSCNALTI